MNSSSVREKSTNNPVIYALEDGQDRIFYVGKTASPKSRLYQHRVAHGDHIRMRVVQQQFVDETPAQAERKWIEHYHRLGASLLNVNVYAAVLAEEKRVAHRPECFKRRPETLAFFKQQGSIGGKKSAKLLTAEERSLKAKKAAAKSAEVRSKKAAAKKAAKKR